MSSRWDAFKAEAHAITVDFEGNFWLGDEKLPVSEYGLLVERFCANQRMSNYRLYRLYQNRATPTDMYQK